MKQSKTKQNFSKQKNMMRFEPFDLLDQSCYNFYNFLNFNVKFSVYILKVRTLRTKEKISFFFFNFTVAFPLKVKIAMEAL